MRSFFCIFCNSIFESRQQIYEHLRKIPYHEQIADDSETDAKNGSLNGATSNHKGKSKAVQPSDCYSKLNLPESEHRPEADDPIEDYEEAEKEFADWIERFLLFQDSLQNYVKPINPVNRTLLKGELEVQQTARHSNVQIIISEFRIFSDFCSISFPFEFLLHFKSLNQLILSFAGCPVCDSIIQIYQQQDPDLIDNSSINKLTAHTNGSALKAKAHVFEHLRYYPYKCSSCCQKNRNKQFSNNEDFKKHNVRMHFKEPNLLRKVKLKKLERFVEVTLKPSFM